MQREYDIRFRVLMEASKTATVLISVKTGAIVTCNRPAEKLLGKTRETMVDASLVEEFESKGREDLVARLVSTASEQSISPVMAKSTQGKCKLSLSPTLFRGANGQMLLCKIRMAGSHETPADQLQVQLAELYQNGVDALVFVDASGRATSKQINDVDMQSVIELIGGESLKDIVARTTDVVEKMCVETAVEMTSNNRVAAPQMLGLSRQSLYVKLRKYGLVSKDRVSTAPSLMPGFLPCSLTIPEVGHLHFASSTFKAAAGEVAAKTDTKILVRLAATYTFRR